VHSGAGVERHDVRTVDRGRSDASQGKGASRAKDGRFSRIGLRDGTKKRLVETVLKTPLEGDSGTERPASASRYARARMQEPGKWPPTYPKRGD
jgi:hypothetical protein